jgi:hypothetical protein
VLATVTISIDVEHGLMRGVALARRGLMAIVNPRKPTVPVSRHVALEGLMHAVLVQ